MNETGLEAEPAVKTRRRRHSVLLCDFPYLHLFEMLCNKVVF